MGKRIREKSLNELNDDLRLAVLNDSLEKIKELITIDFTEKGSDFNSPEENGETIIHFTAAYGTLEALSLLKKLGANIYVADNENNTALHTAARTNNIAIVKFLVNQGLDINGQNINGETALSLAALYNKLTVAKYLLENGADKDQYDKMGNTPLHIALNEGNLEVAYELINKKADYSKVNNYGQTPLDVAIKTYLKCDDYNEKNEYFDLAMKLFAAGAPLGNYTENTREQQTNSYDVSIYESVQSQNNLHDEDHDPEGNLVIMTNDNIYHT
jgi:ankyrin repeat protein